MALPPRNAPPPLWTLIGILGIVVTGLVLRWVLISLALDGTPLPVGPDAEDWSAAVIQMLNGQWSDLQNNRYPLVPWMAAGMTGPLSISPVSALMWISVASSGVLPIVIWILARHFVGEWGALAVAAWTGCTVSQVAFGVFPIGYPLFVLAFCTTATAIVVAPRQPGARRIAWVLAGLGAFAATSGLNQGFVCMLALLPAVALTRAWGVGLSTCVGMLLGLALVGWIHPTHHSPFGWMIAESWLYLSGNIPEEIARADMSYLAAWGAWCRQIAYLPWFWVMGLLAMAGVSLWRTRERAIWAIAWALAPLCVLTAVMASRHHMMHLIPLLAVAVAAGIRHLLPGRWATMAGAGVLVGLGAHNIEPWRQVVDDLTRQGEAAQQQVGLAEILETALGDRGVAIVVTDDLQGQGMAFRSAWAISSGVQLVAPPDPDDLLAMPSWSMELRRFGGVLVATVEDPPPIQVADTLYRPGALAGSIEVGPRGHLVELRVFRLQAPALGHGLPGTGTLGEGGGR